MLSQIDLSLTGSGQVLSSGLGGACISHSHLHRPHIGSHDPKRCWGLPSLKVAGEGQFLFSLSRAPAGKIIHCGHWSRERQGVRVGKMSRELEGHTEESRREGMLEEEAEKKRDTYRERNRERGPWLVHCKRLGAPEAVGGAWRDLPLALPTSALPSVLPAPSDSSHVRLRHLSKQVQDHTSQLRRREAEARA